MIRVEVQNETGRRGAVSYMPSRDFPDLPWYVWVGRKNFTVTNHFATLKEGLVWCFKELEIDWEERGYEYV